MEKFLNKIENMFMRGSINAARREIDLCLEDDLWRYNVETLLLASQIYLGRDNKKALYYALEAYDCSIDQVELYESLSYKASIYHLIAEELEKNSINALADVLKNYELSRECLFEMRTYNNNDKDVLLDLRKVNKNINRIRFDLSDIPEIVLLNQIIENTLDMNKPF